MSFDSISGIDSRQLAVLSLLATGKSNEEISRQLKIRCKTIKNFMRTVYQITGARSRLQLALLVHSNADLKAKADETMLSFMATSNTAV
jgi:DNA-binding NarL/FixJ family response regulator